MCVLKKKCKKIIIKYENERKRGQQGGRARQEERTAKLDKTNERKTEKK